MSCRICCESVSNIIDLGVSPPANSLLDVPSDNIEKFPLVLEFCNNCGNLQLRDCLDINDLYKHYYYVTPKSNTLENHYEFLTRFLEQKNYLNKNSNVLEVGSNLGLYLQFIKKRAKSILGIDPATNIVKKANQNGIPTICNFFNQELADDFNKDEKSFELIIARHCFAHNSSPHNLLKGVKKILSKDGYVVIENAYALNTIENNEFDQIYHEHMFYFSIRSMNEAFKINGLQLHDVCLSLIHGGSIVFVASHASAQRKESKSLLMHLSHEKQNLNLKALDSFAKNTFTLKKDLNILISDLIKKGKKIYTYGATAKGNTLLNFLGITKKQIEYCIDSTEIKQGKYLPGSNIKIESEEFALKNPPDYFLLTAWNYKDEIITKVRNAGNNDSIFIIPFPSLTII